VSGERNHRWRRWSLGGAAIGILVLAPQTAAAQGGGGSCVACHAALGDGPLGAPARSFPADIHAERGFGCVACHGGDETAAGFEAMDPAKGFLGRPQGRMLLDVCGRCHSSASFMRRYNPALRVDQVVEYLTSVHGQRLMQLNDSLVATCSSCHTPHRIRPPSDPLSSVHPLNVETTCGACHADAARMETYGLPTDQMQDYRTSIHRRMLVEENDLSAPTCNDCHGNHGAAPPGISWVGNVCSQCHATMGQLFRESRHAQTFVMLGVPGCATCHGNHAIGEATTEMLGVTEGTVCSQCHGAGDAGGVIAANMRQLLDSLESRFDSAHALLEEAERAGIEVSQALFELEGANNARIGARAAVHSFGLVAVETEVAAGLEVTSAGIVAGEDALSELRFRRLGLAVSVMIILALVGGLVLKIRELDRRGTTI